MSDDAGAFWNSFSEVMNCPNTKRLLCSWHVDKNWRKKLMVIKDVSTRAKVYKMLCLIRLDPEQEKCKKMMSNFIKKYKIDEENENVGKKQKEVSKKSKGVSKEPECVDKMLEGVGKEVVKTKPVESVAQPPQKEIKKTEREKEEKGCDEFVRYFESTYLKRAEL